jgi:transposase
MMGIKERHFQRHNSLCLDDLVPANNFYRQLQTKLDLSFVRDLVCDYYAPFGRPSIDPVVFFKLQLIMIFEAIRSERQLVDTVAMRLDHPGIWGMTSPKRCRIIRACPEFAIDMESPSFNASSSTLSSNV